MNKQIAVLGCGWLGLPLAISLVEKGYLVKGSTTSDSKLTQLKSKGIRPYLISLSEHGISGNIEDFLTDVQLLIINIPPKLRGAQSENYVKKMYLLHEEIKRSQIKQVIFVSSTSVYGNIIGDVTEATVPEPATESGKQLLEAETIFSTSKSLQTTIIRFGGLIGEDRHPIKTLSGRKSLPNGNYCVNLIHRFDCIRIIEYVFQAKLWHTIVNGVYPYHPTKQNYYAAEAQKLRLQTPEYEVNNIGLGKKVVPQTLLNVKKFSFNTSISS